MNKIPNRKAICDVLLKEAETDKDIVVLCSDSRGSASLAPAIVWQCSRASEICERIKTNVMIDPTVNRRKTAVWQRSSARRQECIFPRIFRQRSLYGFRRMWRK